MSEMSRVFVVDDHPIVRLGIVQMLKEIDGLIVCGEASAIDEAKSKIRPGEVDLLVLDIHLKNNESGLDLMRELHRHDRDLKVLVLSMMEGKVFATRALEGGAAGFVMKEQATDELALAIKTVLSGEKYLNPELAKAIEDWEDEFARVSLLSGRELQVFELIGGGKPTREIGVDLDISSRTVDAHKEHIKTKLKVGSAAELARTAIRWVERENGSGNL